MPSCISISSPYGKGWRWIVVPGFFNKKWHGWTMISNYDET